MNSELLQSMIRLTLAASQHSQRVWLSGYKIEPLTDEQIISIGEELVRKFEELYEIEIERVPQKFSGTPSGSVGGDRQRRRLRDQ